MHLRDLRDRINVSTTKPEMHRAGKQVPTGTNRFPKRYKQVPTGTNKYSGLNYTGGIPVETGTGIPEVPPTRGHLCLVFNVKMVFF